MKTIQTLLSLAVGIAIAAGVAANAAAAGSAALPITRGPFQPTMESLTHFDCPEWFRDAKFGIWAHWGPQSAPRWGDWDARPRRQDRWQLQGKL